MAFSNTYLLHGYTTMYYKCNIPHALQCSHSQPLGLNLKCSEIKINALADFNWVRSEITISLHFAGKMPLRVVVWHSGNIAGCPINEVTLQ